MTPPLLSFALALALTTVLMPLCIRYAARLRLVDAPDAVRKVHVRVIPRSGGVAIVIGSILGAGLWMPRDHGYLALAGAIAIIIVFGYLDDRLTLGSRQKLLGQCMAAGVFLAAYGGFAQLPFLPLDSSPGWLALISSFVFLVGVTNAVNLSDGLDGLAAGNSLLAIGLLAVLGAEAGRLDYVVVALALAGGLLGFLRFNTHPARLFMGDTGSQFLGFSAAALTVLIFREEAIPASPLLPLLIFGLPILDTLSVMTVRALRGRPLFAADRSHLHHQLLKLGFQHYEVVAVMYALQAAAVVLAYLLRYASDLAVLAAYGTYSAVVLGGIMIGRTTNWQARAILAAERPVERRNLWLRRFKWFHTNTARVISAMIAITLVGSALLNHVLGSDVAQDSNDVADLALIAAALLIAGTVIFRTHLQVVVVLSSFVATAFVVYGFVERTGGQSTFNWAPDLCFVAFGILLLLAMRVTRKVQFHLDTQDYLLLFIAAVVPFLPIDRVDGMMLARGGLRAVVLLYACEFVATKGRNSRWLVNGAAIASLVIIGLGRQG